MKVLLYIKVEAVPPARQTKSSRGSSALKLIKNPVHQYNNIEVIIIIIVMILIIIIIMIKISIIVMITGWNKS